jgi:hypothetical protein
MALRVGDTADTAVRNGQSGLEVPGVDLVVRHQPEERAVNNFEVADARFVTDVLAVGGTLAYDSETWLRSERARSIAAIAYAEDCAGLALRPHRRHDRGAIADARSGASLARKPARRGPHHPQDPPRGGAGPDMCA